ncbi:MULTISPECIES: hypothetical protein [Staphylococcus]|nr:MULTISPECIES: hypothetical protein [Staphylococcus]MDK9844714.1 hypothetical protein [Staphylococcus equorum]PTE86068.1 hypothetical protein BUY90_08160 [Staphylococcus equorum]PTH45097.1 hypothetical protein BU596_07055 [Staphylococcus arlettae]PTJ62287.1 hypothetical protein BUZ76_12795 [Staphylococcus saprophyticus]PTK35110.1 hypothetical protein BUZ68_00790 [Staphylococcus saprophyticus]
MKEIITITALYYGIITGIWYLYVGYGELEGLKKKITTVLSILNSLIVIIFGGLTLLNLLGIISYDQPLILLALSIFQLSILEENKVRVLYIYFGLSLLIINIFIR